MQNNLDRQNLMETFKNLTGELFGFSYPPIDTQDGCGVWASILVVATYTLASTGSSTPGPLSTSLDFLALMTPMAVRTLSQNWKSSPTRPRAYTQRENTPCSWFTICDLSPDLSPVQRSELYGHLVEGCPHKPICNIHVCKAHRPNVQQLSLCGDCGSIVCNVPTQIPGCTPVICSHILRSHWRTFYLDQSSSSIVPNRRRCSPCYQKLIYTSSCEVHS
jgi:hypothetical protein